MASWIFVMTGDVEGFGGRIKSGEWPIFRKTHHRNEMRAGDKIVFYLGGKNNKKLMGIATISSGLRKNGEEYFVSISEVEVWKDPLEMRKLVDSLGFIKNKDNWGLYLQGGVIPLPQKDHDTILARNVKAKANKA